MSRYRCKEGHFGPKCRCERKPGRGECDNEGVLHCLGHWTGTNCDTCRPGYSGPQCLHQDTGSLKSEYVRKGIVSYQTVIDECIVKHG